MYRRVLQTSDVLAIKEDRIERTGNDSVCLINDV